jgi:preprotein translocase subunit SecA
MRLFGGDQVARLMTAFKLPEDVPLEHPMVSRAIEQAQVKVEGFHFDSRKHLVEYDDVLNRQREIVYKRRRKILEGERLKGKILENIQDEVSNVATIYASEGAVDRQKIVTEFSSIIPFDAHSQEHLLKQLEGMHTPEEMGEFLGKLATDMYENREKQVSSEVMAQVERWVSLSVIDNLWMDHLDAIDDLREGIGLRGYGQRDPLVEYKNEAFSMFERLMSSIDSEIIHRIYKVQIQMNPSQSTEPPKIETAMSQAAQKMQTNTKATSSPSSATAEKKLNRNDPCWCGSGKKWKKCHYPKMK